MVKNIDGNINLFDPFTKEQKNKEHFLHIRDVLLSIPPNCDTNNSDTFASNPKNFDSMYEATG